MVSSQSNINTAWHINYYVDLFYEVFPHSIHSTLTSTSTDYEYSAKYAAKRNLYSTYRSQTDPTSATQSRYSMWLPTMICPSLSPISSRNALATHSDLCPCCFSLSTQRPTHLSHPLFPIDLSTFDYIKQLPENTNLTVNFCTTSNSANPVNKSKIVSNKFKDKHAI